MWIWRCSKNARKKCGDKWCDPKSRCSSRRECICPKDNPGDAHMGWCGGPTTTTSGTTTDYKNYHSTGDILTTESPITTEGRSTTEIKETTTEDPININSSSVRSTEKCDDNKYFYLLFLNLLAIPLAIIICCCRIHKPTTKAPVGPFDAIQNPIYNNPYETA